MSKKQNTKHYDRQMAAQKAQMDHQRCRLFVIHYIKTLDSYASAKFAGYEEPQIAGEALLREPYVQNEISRLLDDLDDKAIMTRNEIMFRLKYEAHNMEAQNQSARITALDKIAKISGIMEEEGAKTINNVHVMVVPPMGSADEWGENAEGQQSELKQDVRT